MSSHDNKVGTTYDDHIVINPKVLCTFQIKNLRWADGCNKHDNLEGLPPPQTMIFRPILNSQCDTNNLAFKLVLVKQMKGWVGGWMGKIDE